MLNIPAGISWKSGKIQKKPQLWRDAFTFSPKKLRFPASLG
jgi:hypothetical protein